MLSKYPQPIFISGCIINLNTSSNFIPQQKEKSNLKELIKSIGEEDNEEEDDNTWKWIAGLVAGGLAILLLYLWLRPKKETTSLSSFGMKAEGPIEIKSDVPQENTSETNDLLKSMINQMKPSNDYITNQSKVRTAGTPIMLVQPNNSRTFVVKANTGNVGKIYIGTRGVTPTTGIPLDPGESFSLDVRMDKSSIYMDADNDGDGSSFMLFS